MEFKIGYLYCLFSLKLPIKVKEEFEMETQDSTAKKGVKSDPKNFKFVAVTFKFLK